MACLLASWLTSIQTRQHHPQTWKGCKWKKWNYLLGYYISMRGCLQRLLNIILLIINCLIIKALLKLITQFIAFSYSKPIELLVQFNSKMNSLPNFESCGMEYDMFCSWTRDSLDIIRPFFHALQFPLFFHWWFCGWFILFYLKLHCADNVSCFCFFNLLEAIFCFSSKI